MGKNPGSIIGNSVNKSDQVLVHWLLWSRPVLIFNSCCHTRTQTHTQTHTPRLTRSTAQSLALLRAESWSERSGARCVFSGLLVCAERARILWITVRWCSQCARNDLRGSWIWISSRFLFEIDRYFGESIVDDLSSALSTIRVGILWTKILCVLSRSPNISKRTLVKWNKLRFHSVSWRSRRRFFSFERRRKSLSMKIYCCGRLFCVQWKFLILSPLNNIFLHWIYSQ